MVLISGASSGMGAAAARALARHGHHVLAGVRNDADAEAIRGENLEPVLLDVTDADQVDAVARRIEHDPEGRALEVLINNAGIAVIAPVEALALDEWRTQFEVNLFGHIALTQAVLPFLHASGGRILNVSSIGGKVALPSYGAYAGTKFALEAVSDSLRRELAPHGVKVVVIEPGGVRTQMTDQAIVRSTRMVDEMTPTHRARYGRLMHGVISHASAFTDRGVSAERAAAVFVEAATTARPRARYTIGRDSAVLTRVARLAPDRALDRMLAADLRPHLPADQPAS